jgi:hypothetical protein
MPSRKVLLMMALSLLASACTRSVATLIPTLAGPANTRTSAPTATVPPLTPSQPVLASASPEQTATPDDARREAIFIIEPGFGSAVTSPVRVAGEADPTFEQTIVVQISDVAGNVIATTPAQIAADIGQRGPFSAQVEFTVDADQPGRISVFVASPRDGGLIHLTSVEVTLLAPGGAAAFNPAQPQDESLLLFTPEFLANLSGGTVHVTGFSAPVFENNLMVAVCGQGGVGEPDRICGTADNVLGRGNATVNAPDVGQPGPFETEVAYAAPSTMRGRVVVYSASARDGGLTHLSSREVVLEP